MLYRNVSFRFIAVLAVFFFAGASANAASFSFVDSVSEVFGIEASASPAFIFRSETSDNAQSVRLIPDKSSAVSTGIVISQVYGGGGNTGATYTHDFIELFNRGNTTIDVTGWSVQYASATGSSWQVTNLSGMIAPGKYFLVQQAAGTGGTTPLPTPDVTGTIAMGATAGKIALVNVTTALTGTCPTVASIIDFVGYGTTANCFEGTGPAPAPSNTVADIRGMAGCTETDQNSTDFTTGAPTPRNSATLANICGGGGPTNPSGVGAANPSAVLAGAMSLLTVNVTPGTMPASTGITVTTNLTTIGGAAVQMFFDDGTNGDVTPADNIFSYNATVSMATMPGPKTLPFTISDLEARMGNGNISLTINLPPVQIHDIQGSGTSSPLVGQVVTTSGIVTGTKSNGFFIQEPDASVDADSETSEGIFVFTSSAPPAAAVIGNNVSVTGTIVEFISSTTGGPPLTELSSPTVNLLSTGNPLPVPILITALETTQPSETTNALDSLEEYEGMRVTVGSLTVSGATQGTITESSATVASNGVFYGVVTGVPRPFREPGIAISNTVPAPMPVNVPRFDENPERLRIDSDAQPGTIALDVAAGTVITNITGPLDYAFRTYSIYPDLASPPTVGVQPGVVPVPTATVNELTIASFNMERFFDTVDDPGTSDPVLTVAAFNRRVAKASLIIRTVQKYPDVIGVQEVEHLSTLQTVATQINNDAVIIDGLPNPNYTAYLVEGNDVGGIDVGFLVKQSRVTPSSTFQLELPGCVGTGATCYNFVNPNTGGLDLLNDRPPLVLIASIPKPGGGTLTFTVITNHLRSLSGIDDNTVSGSGTVGARIREKRRKQAEFLANYIQSRQVADSAENIINLGDMNAFRVNDGYVDLIGTMLGTPTPADQVVLPSADLVNPNQTNLLDLLPAAQQYSYNFDGNTQTLDHIIVNPPAFSLLTRVAYARNDSDFPVKNYENTSELRLSDHDQPVAYFTLLAPTAASVSIAGRVLTANGQAIRNAIISVDGGSLTERRYAQTGTFGYYRMEGLQAGETYVVTINARRYTFQVPTRVITAVDEVTVADFIAYPEE